jgi:hypothetical protein
MSTVFETGTPKFIGSDTNGVSLYYSILTFTEEKTQKMFQSPVSETGHRTFKNQGTVADHARHMTFNVHIELHKFDTIRDDSPFDAPPYDSAKAFANLLLTYEDDDVTFYPFYNSGNELAVKNNADSIVKCHLVSITFNFKDNAGALGDVCDLVFMTNDFCDIRKLIKT